MKYDSYKMPDGRTIVRPTHNGTTTLRQLLKEMESETTLTEADGLAVMSYVATYLARELSHGRFVTIDGLGTFGVSLRVDPNRDEADIDGHDVRVKRVTFKAAPQLMATISGKAKKERVDKDVRNIATPRYTPEERRTILMRILDIKPEFTAAEYLANTGISQVTAHRDLTEYESQGLITHRCIGRTKIYSKS